MDQVNTKNQENKETSSSTQDPKKKSGQWIKPILEDVSGKIMAQPYIRFT